MQKSQFKKIYTYDWFCGPGSHLNIFVANILKNLAKIYFSKSTIFSVFCLYANVKLKAKSWNCLPEYFQLKLAANDFTGFWDYCDFHNTAIFRLIIRTDRDLRFIHLLWWLLFKCRQVNMKRTSISLCSIYKASFGLGRHRIYFMIIWTTVMMLFFMWTWLIGLLVTL